jgi:hypothetical protein
VDRNNEKPRGSLSPKPCHLIHGAHWLCAPIARLSRSDDNTTNDLAGHSFDFLSLPAPRKKPTQCLRNKDTAVSESLRMLDRRCGGLEFEMAQEDPVCDDTNDLIC